MPCEQLSPHQTAGRHLGLLYTCKYSRRERELGVYLRSSQCGYLRSLSLLSLARMAPPSLCRLTNLLSPSTSLIRVLCSVMHCCTACWTKIDFNISKRSSDIFKNFLRCNFVKFIVEAFLCAVPNNLCIYRNHYLHNNTLHTMYYQ